MKPLIRLVVIVVFLLAMPAMAQHIICGNDLINVNGNWIGANRDSKQCPKEKISRDKSQAEERDDDDIDRSQCEVYNTGYISTMLRYERSIACAAAFMLVRSNIDAEERGLYWKPDRNRFRQCLGANGFSPEERENIIKWQPPASGNSPAIAAQYMTKSSNARIKLMEDCQAYGVKSGSYIPPWKTQEAKPRKTMIRAIPAQQ